MLKKLDHVGFTVWDLDRSLAFYRDLLGLQLDWERVYEEEYVRRVVGYPSLRLRCALLKLPGTKTRLELLQYEGVSRQRVDMHTANPGNGHICIAVGDLDEIYQRGPLQPEAPIARTSALDKPVPICETRIMQDQVETFVKEPQETRRNRMKMFKIFPTLKSAYVRILLLSCLVVAATGLWADPPKRVNVIFFALDQLQANRLHSYGNPRETSPNIDRLAQRGVRFSHFFSVAPWTSPSFASLHTSLYPSRHGVTLEWGPGDPLIYNGTPMMVPVFQDHGYHTTAYVNNNYDGYQLIGRGFDEFYEEQTQAINITERQQTKNPYTAIEETKDVLAWLDQHKSENFFLYVHFYEPHSPYNPPPEDDLFRSDAYPYLFDTGYDVAHAPAKRLAMLGDQKAIERLYQLYDGKIHFIDRYVGEILDRVRALGLEENTLVVLTSDHGELLYSHPSDYLTFDHRSLYDAVLHIPMILAGPGVPRERVIDGLASNVDTAPTVLELAGLPPLSGAEGQSLVPLIRGVRESLNSYVYSEEDLMPPGRAVRTLHHKLIRNLWTGKEMLFDVDHDPDEQHDVAQDNPAVMKDLRDHLDEWVKQNEPPKEEQLRRFRIYSKNEAELHSENEGEFGQAGTGAYPTVTIDDMTIGAKFDLGGRGWHSDTEPRSANYAQGCFWTEPGDGSRTAIWRTDNPLRPGTYKIYVYYGHPSVGRLATNAPFTVVTDKDSKTARLDFTKEAGEWHLLGTFHNLRYVSLSNAADGVIVADAVRFVMVSPE